MRQELKSYRVLWSTSDALVTLLDLSGFKNINFSDRVFVCFLSVLTNKCKLELLLEELFMQNCQKYKQLLVKRHYTQRDLKSAFSFQPGFNSSL